MARLKLLTPAPFNAGALLVQTTYGYDADGRVTSVTRANGDTPQVTRTTYTPIGQVSSVTDPKDNVTRYDYDAAARLREVTDPLGRSTAYTYNARGQLATVVDATGTTAAQYTYAPNGPVLTFTDAAGNVTRHVRDGFDRVSQSTYAYGTGLASSEEFSYDANNNLVSHTTRAGQAIRFAYDALNRLCTKTIGSGATACTAATSSDPAVWRSYDLAGRPTGVRDNSASVVAVSATASYAVSASYDELNRPRSVSWNNAPSQTTPTGASVTFTHGYNAVDQRISQSISDNTWMQYPSGPSSTAYTANSLNQYTAVGPTKPTYDANGNLATDGSFTYCHDAESRLTRILTSGSCAAPGTTVASYAYDAQGRRKSKTIGGTTTIFVTDADNREVLEYDGSSGAIQAWYAYGAGTNEVLNRMDVVAGTRQTFVADVQGSIVGTLASNTGTLTKRNYLPFGENPALTSGSFLYTGQRFDPETAGSTYQPSGLYYYRARTYSPTWGRFLQTDPIGTEGGANLYRYVDNDPLNLNDPQGLAAEAIGAGAVGFGGALADRFMSGEAASDIAKHGILGVLSDMASVALGGVRVVGSVAKSGAELTRVGRWMGKAEFETMSKTGRVVEGAGGRTSVIRPPNSSSYTSARPGSVYAEFDVPTSALRPGADQIGRLFRAPTSRRGFSARPHWECHPQRASSVLLENKMNILDCVEVWVHSLHCVFDSAGIAVRFNRTVDQRPNASCVFNLRHDVTEADLVVWESGEADLSVIVAEGATEQVHFDDLSDTKELAAVLSRVAKLMLITIAE